MATQARRMTMEPMWDTQASLARVIPLRLVERPARESARPIAADVAGGVLTLGTWLAVWAWFLAATL